jgi:hypothetical protein
LTLWSRFDARYESPVVGMEGSAAVTKEEMDSGSGLHQFLGAGHEFRAGAAHFDWPKTQDGFKMVPHQPIAIATLG